VYGGASSTQSTEQSTVSAAHSPQSPQPTEHRAHGGWRRRRERRAARGLCKCYSTQHTAHSSNSAGGGGASNYKKYKTYNLQPVVRASFFVVVRCFRSPLSPQPTAQCTGLSSPAPAPWPQQLVSGLRPAACGLLSCSACATTRATGCWLNWLLLGTVSRI
jgi:hypothetical protein